MRLLLDSHTLIWAADNAAKVLAPAMVAMSHPHASLLVSVGTVWVIAIKSGLGNLPIPVGTVL